MSNKQKFTHYIFLVIEFTAGSTVAGLIVYSMILAFQNL
jgi:hypothetical protein